MITHLYTKYAKITDQDIQANNTHMKPPYDPNAPIENLHKQISEAVEYVSIEDTPYTHLQVVSTAY